MVTVKKQRRWLRQYSASFFFFPLLFIHSGTPPPTWETVLPTSRVGFPSIVKSFRKHSPRHTQSCALPVPQVFLNPIKLSTKVHRPSSLSKTRHLTKLCELLASPHRDSVNVSNSKDPKLNLCFLLPGPLIQLP